VTGIARPQNAERIRTWAIITGEPNELVAPIHNRMPVILPREACSAWLGDHPATRMICKRCSDHFQPSACART
jgi:putative SOS response-associated peptidase YedK